MQFLYGDSTPSPLVTDWIDLLGKALDCFVSLFQAEQRMALGAARRRELETKAEQEAARLRELESVVARAIASMIEGASPDASINRCSDIISRAAGAAVTAAEAEVRGALGSEIQRIDESAARERARAVKAVEQLLLEHDLPGSDLELRIDPRPGGGYAATLRGSTSYGVASVIGLEVPAASLLARSLRVGDVVEGLEIQVPKTAGWIRKESRLSTEKLGRFLVCGCAVGARSKRVATRTDALDEGYDFHLSGDGSPARAVRISPGGAAPTEFELGEGDARAVAAFIDRLVASIQELAANRKALMQVEIDGEPFENHRLPSTLVARMVEVMAPAVREIAARSGSALELVLRRQLGDGRREERFVRRADLLAKLAPLPRIQRAVLAPFALGEIPDAGEEGSVEISAGSIVELPTTGGPEEVPGRPAGPPPLRAPS
jgi:hypothetical protein